MSYFIQRRALAELDKKIIVPLKKFIPHNNYGHLKSGVGHFVTDNMAVYIVPMSLVFYGRAENLSRKALKRENVFHPKKASSPFPESPNLYLMSSGDVYDVPSFHCAVPGRLKGNIFQENLKQIIDRTMQQTVFRVERERGIRGIYHHLYANGVRIKANDHCELCRSIFADKKSIDTYNMLLSEPWKKYEHKLIERFNANNSLPSLDIRSQGI